MRRGGGVLLFGDLLQEILRQQRNVVRPLPQGRQMNRHDVQPIEEILAKRVLLNHSRNIAAGRGDHAHVDLVILLPAHRCHRERLQHAQKFCLKSQLEVPDFVHEERSAARLFKAADAFVRCAGESAAHMPEKFAFHEGRRYRARNSPPQTAPFAAGCFGAAPGRPVLFPSRFPPK